jgi:3',5'-cyclic AMP phosphodiesterase CpdA
MAEIASLLQVSDLHFYQNLTFAGGRHWGLSAFGVKGHSHSKLFTFARTILTRRLAEGLEDVVIATGDISTDGTERSLEIAKTFFDQAMVYENGRLATYGLALPKHRRLILPGNHDRYGRFLVPYESSANRALERVFDLKDEYPYVVGYRRAEHWQNPNAPTLLFFVFDSTLTGESADSPSPFKRIARGLITTQDCDWLQTMPEILRKQGHVPDLEGQPLPFQYENSIRIVLLHHHPVRKERRGLFQLLDKQSWSVMEEAERFVDACFKAEIDLVLFGHEHENYNESEQREIQYWKSSKRTHTIRFVCCPSTTEYSEDKTGFYFVDFDANEYHMTLYEWKGTAYVKERTYDQPYNRPLTLVARRA